MDDTFLENITYAELTVGRQGTLTRTLTQDDITLFAVMSGDVNPAHMDAEYAKSDMFHGIIGQLGIYELSQVISRQRVVVVECAIGGFGCCP